MKTFLKSIIIGLGGVAPGISGSVLMILFGLYQPTLDALGTVFVDFRKKIRFLLPVVAGMAVGVLLFSKMLNFFLVSFEMPTRYLFLGLIVGTVPLFFREVRKNGFSWKYYPLIGAALVGSLLLLRLNPNLFPQVADPNFLQKVFLGVALAVAFIVPGLEPAVLLSAFGLYEVYVESLANMNFAVLGPMVIGLALGAVGVSFAVSRLFKYFYTATFSVVFGVFLSMIPSILNESCHLGWNLPSVISVLLVVPGFAISFYLSDISGHNKKLRALFKKNVAPPNS